MERTARRVQPLSYRRSAPTAAKKPAPQLQRRRMRFGAVEIGVLVAVSIVALMMIGMPLRNFFQQRSDIARVTESIQSKEAEKQRLINELEKYQSEAFIRQQARIRLGVIEPGETAFRILSPELEAESSTGQTPADETANQPWYDTLWESVATPDADTRIGLPDAPAPADATNNLPIAPVEAPPAEAPVEPPAAPPAAPPAEAPAPQP